MTPVRTTAYRCHQGPGQHRGYLECHSKSQQWTSAMPAPFSSFLHCTWRKLYACVTHLYLGLKSNAVFQESSASVDCIKQSHGNVKTEIVSISLLLLSPTPLNYVQFYIFPFGNAIPAEFKINFLSKPLFSFRIPKIILGKVTFFRQQAASEDLNVKWLFLKCDLKYACSPCNWWIAVKLLMTFPNMSLKAPLIFTQCLSGMMNR